MVTPQLSPEPAARYDIRFAQMLGPSILTHDTKDMLRQSGTQLNDSVKNHKLDHVRECWQVLLYADGDTPPQYELFVLKAKSEFACKTMWIKSGWILSSA